MSTALLNRSEVSGQIHTSYEARMAAGGYAAMSLFTKSAAASQLYRWAGLVPKFRERQGQSYFEALPTYEIDVRNKSWISGVDVPVDDIDDDQTGTIQASLASFGAAGADLWAERIDELLKYGDTTTLGSAFDGQKFFAVAASPHAVGNSGNMINDVTATEVPSLNVTLAAPTVVEIAAALLDTIAYFFTYKDDKGRPINMGVKSFGVIVPPNLAGVFLSAVAEKNLTGGQTNPLNQFNIEVFVNGGVDWTAEFAVFIKDSAEKPFVVQERQPLVVTTLDLDNAPAYVVENDAVGVRGKMRGNVAYGMFTKIIKATLS